MIERTGVRRSGQGGPLLGSAALWVSCSLLLFSSGCGSHSTDETARARPDQGDDATEADDDTSGRGAGDAGEADDDSAGSDGTPTNESDSNDDSTGTPSLPDDEEVASLCSDLCEAWADCEEVGGAECVDECNGSTSSTMESGCYPLVQALFDCVLASNECPEQAPCETEADALGRCMEGADVTSGEVTANPSPMVVGSSTDGSGSDSSGSASGSGSGGSGGAPAPSSPNDAQPSDGETDVDPAEPFGGEDSTPDAILEASELPQCSEFEVAEFECGSSGYSSGGGLCTADCYDRDDIVWSTLCRDGICRCQYDGITYCQCAHAGQSDTGCNSCCPQLTDADFEF